MNYLADKKVVLFSMIATLIMAFIVMVIVDPLIDGKNGFDVIALQLSYSKDIGIGIVSNWNIETFKKWIVMDYIYALSYVIFFASLILWMEREKHMPRSIYPYIALCAGIFDWIENSLELWFFHDINGFSPILFFIHSIFATLKWLALPIILWHIVKLFKIKGIK